MSVTLNGSLDMASLAKGLFEANVARAFVLADQDNSGRLCFCEVKDIAAGSGKEASTLIATLDVLSLMDALDLDQDGEISFTEFYAFFTTVYEASVPLAEAMLEDVVRKIFERDFVKLVDVLFGHFDKNSDGVLDLAEVKSLVGKPKEGEAFMKAIDENGDKEVSLEEWRELFLAGWRIDPKVGRALAAVMLARVLEGA